MARKELPWASKKPKTLRLQVGVWIDGSFPAQKLISKGMYGTGKQTEIHVLFRG